jgi:polyketide synthase PksJ
MSDIDQNVEAIAIVGITGRFPGAPSVAQLWELLSEGREGITQLSDDALRADGLSPKTLAHPNYVKSEAVLADADAFDPGFFGYTDADAARLDPQHRLFLECAWHALEDAGCVPETFPGPIGVFAGVGLGRGGARVPAVRKQTDDEFASFYSDVIASSNDFLTTRLSYKLDLRGPSVTVQTACSTSLVAIHMACVSLQSCECDLALAGGVSVRARQGTGYLWQEGGIASRDGKCRAFDASATGTVPGSGAAVVALRRLSDAVRDRNHIYAVIRGTAVNNDGARKVGFTAPGIQGQTEVIAMAQAGLDPRTIGMLEAHGTGTELGDATELAALHQVFHGTGNGAHCALGSLKTNIGHLDTASGAAGLIKAALCLKHQRLVPSLHLQNPCSGLRSDGPFYVPTDSRPWPHQRWPRRAGVSSFGIGGTNAHAVLEEAPSLPTLGESTAVQLLPVSARTETALRAAALALAGHLRAFPSDSLADVARTLQKGRRAFAVRKVFFARDRDELIARLEQFANGPTATDEPCEAGGPLRTAAAQWQQGGAVDWETLCNNRDRGLLSLPGYPFERKRFPAERPEAATVPEPAPASSAFYTNSWRQLPLHSSTDQTLEDARSWILVGWDHPLETRLAEHLQRKGRRVMRLIADSTVKASGGASAQYVDLTDTGQVTQALQSLQQSGITPARVVYFAGLLPPAGGAEEVRALAAQDTGVIGAAALARAFDAVYPQLSYSLLAVTTGGVCTPTDITVEPAHACLHAFGAVLAQEFPNISFTAVDLPHASHEPSGSLSESYLDWICAEPTAHQPRQLVAYRRLRRLVPEPIKETAGAEPIRAIQRQGVYVITGGLGRIGLDLAETLAREHQARLLLLSRTRLPERSDWNARVADPACPPELATKLTRLLEIERAGGGLQVAAVDVSDESAVRRAVGLAREKLGPIRGVFHLAADLSDSSAQRPIRNLGRQDLVSQFRAKVAGFHVLERVFRGARLDFGVLFSSNASFLGGVGLCAYAAANAYLNAAASLSHGNDDVPWVALSWDGWHADAAEDPQGTALSPAEGMRALLEILPHTASACVMVSKTELLARLPKPVRADSMSPAVELSESIAIDAALPAREQRPSLETEYVAPRTELERTIVDVWEETLGIEGIGVQDDLFELNGDSLRAMSILARMQELFGVEVPLRQFIGRKPTVFRLSMEIATRLGNT